MPDAPLLQHTIDLMTEVHRMAAEHALDAEETAGAIAAMTAVIMDGEASFSSAVGRVRSLIQVDRHELREWARRSEVGHRARARSAARPSRETGSKPREDGWTEQRRLDFGEHPDS